jgi:hypothetical protein
MPAEPSLLAACWTSAGNAVPSRGLTTSPVDIRARIEAAPARQSGLSELGP